MVKFALTFGYCAVDQEKAIVQWKPAVLGSEIVKFGTEFLLCAVDQESIVFQWKRSFSSPSICPSGVQNDEIRPEFLLLCFRPRKRPFLMEISRL